LYVLLRPFIHQIYQDLEVPSPHRFSLGSNRFPQNHLRIAIDPEHCGGRPCIRGVRIRVLDVLDLFAAGLNADDMRWIDLLFLNSL
jgi:hypothetical protein